MSMNLLELWHTAAAACLYVCMCRIPTYLHEVIRDKHTRKCNAESWLFQEQHLLWLAHAYTYTSLPGSLPLTEWKQWLMFSLLSLCWVTCFMCAITRLTSVFFSSRLDIQCFSGGRKLGLGSWKLGVWLALLSLSKCVRFKVGMFCDGGLKL